MRLQAAVLPHFERSVATEAGLPLSWYDVLLALRAAGGPLAIVSWGPVALRRTRVSRLVDELIAMGLVARETNRVRPRRRAGC